MAWIHAHLPAAWQDWDFSQPIRQGAERIAGFIASNFSGLLKNLTTFFVDLFIVIFSLFFMFRDSESIVRGVKHLIPFDESIQTDMLAESRDLIFASVAVGLVIACLQGLLGGLAFTIGGIPTAVFWGVVMAFFSLVPVVGSALIWVPAALWLGFGGHWGKGITILVICGAVAGTADNIIRPLLLRNRTRLNELLLFIGVLGGLEVFGLLGLVAGPTIVAAAMGVFRVYMDRRDAVADAGSVVFILSGSSNFKLSRTVVVVVAWAGFDLNPHPFKTKKGAAPNCRVMDRCEYVLLRAGEVRRWVQRRKRRRRVGWRRRSWRCLMS